MNRIDARRVAAEGRELSGTIALSTWPRAADSVVDPSVEVDYRIIGGFDDHGRPQLRVAVTGSVDLMPLILFGIVFIWTPPHFWSLALWANDDYRRAGVPMLPVVAGAKETRKQIAIYSLLLVPLSLAPLYLGFSGAVYGMSATVLGLGFLACVWRVLTDKQDATGGSLTNDAPARAAFKYSILYLFVLFAALAVDRLIG